MHSTVFLKMYKLKIDKSFDSSIASLVVVSGDICYILFKHALKYQEIGNQVIFSEILFCIFHVHMTGVVYS